MAQSYCPEEEFILVAVPEGQEFLLVRKRGSRWQAQWLEQEADNLHL